MKNLTYEEVISGKAAPPSRVECFLQRLRMRFGRCRDCWSPAVGDELKDFLAENGVTDTARFEHLASLCHGDLMTWWVRESLRRGGPEAGLPHAWPHPPRS